MAMAFPHTFRLVVAGVLSLPAIGLLVTVAPFVFLLSIPSLAILVRRKRSLFPSFVSSVQHSTSSTNDVPSGEQPGSKHPLLQHAVITGGSSGIGLCVAIALADRGCRHITLLARKKAQLNEAKRMVEEAAAKSAKSTVTVRVVSVDVTDFSSLQKEVKELCGNSKPGPPTLLFNCAGYAIPKAFEDLTTNDFRAQVECNYLGSVHVVKAFVPYMSHPQHTGGNIILTSSMSGQAGTFGYSAYSPTKFALRGFAECMSMELAAKECNVNISLAYPPDTKTPGYEIENEMKPEECRLISESGGIWDPAV